MVRIRQRPNRDVPGLVPAKLCLVEQDAHQLGYSHSWMRVIHLNSDLFGQGSPVIFGATKTANDVGQRTTNQEVLLDEAQRLTGEGRIVGVQYACDGLGRRAIYNGTNEIAGTELTEIEEIRRSRRPKPKRVDVSAAISNYWTIIRNT